MSTSLKRVVSHPEELGNLCKKMSTGDDSPEQLKLPATQHEAAPAAVVEDNDQEEHQEDSKLVSEKQEDVASKEDTAATDETTNEASSPVKAVVIEEANVPFNKEDEVQKAVIDFRGISTLSADDRADSGISRNELNLARLDSRASDVMMTRTQRAGSGSSGTFGWFIDVHGGEGTPKIKEEKKKIAEKDDSSANHIDDASEELTQFIDISQQHVDSGAPLASAMAVTAPNYILEENLSTQMLWKHTAGNRPPQPEEERAYFEMLWRQNFALSNVEYDLTPESLNEGTCDHEQDHYAGNMQTFSSYHLATDFMATDAEVAEAIERLHGTSGAHLRSTDVEGTAPKVVNKTVKGTGNNEDLTVLIKGDNVFGTTVSKSFDRVGPGGNREVDTVNISVASYRVVESKKHGKYAQFLVIYREGSVRDTIGVWKRYSDFEALSRKVVESQDSCSSVLANMSPLAVTEEGDVEHLPNAITSWRLLKKRQRWFRCLDAGYLSLKVFLLERFLHDILFESSSPNLLRDFVIYDMSGSTPRLE